MEQQPSQSTITTGIAVWGAVLGTLTFVWNVRKWRQERPKIFACIEAVESLSKGNSYAGVRLKIRNRGGKQTTVENIILYCRPTWGEFGFQSILMALAGYSAWEQNVAGSNLKTAALPAVLAINGAWEGFIPLEANDEDDEEELRLVERGRHLADALRNGKVRFSIVCSHTNARKTGLVKRVNF